MIRWSTQLPPCLLLRFTDFFAPSFHCKTNPTSPRSKEAQVAQDLSSKDASDHCIVMTKVGIKTQNQNFRNVYLLRKPGREWYDAICRQNVAPLDRATILQHFFAAQNSPKEIHRTSTKHDKTPELRTSSNVCRKSKVLHKRFSNLLQSFSHFISMCFV